jgi:hypothetical protein
MKSEISVEGILVTPFSSSWRQPLNIGCRHSGRSTNYRRPSTRHTHKKEPLRVNSTAPYELPALDEFRNFCFSPQASLGLTLPDIDAFLVA